MNDSITAPPKIERKVKPVPSRSSASSASSASSSSPTAPPEQKNEPAPQAPVEPPAPRLEDRKRLEAEKKMQEKLEASVQRRLEAQRQASEKRRLEKMVREQWQRDAELKEQKRLKGLQEALQARIHSQMGAKDDFYSHEVWNKPICDDQIELEKLEKAKRLNAEDSQILASIRMRLAYEYLENVFENQSTMAILTRHHLTRVPGIIEALKFLTEVNFSDNALANLPHNFFQSLPKLRKIILAGNKLKRIPPFFDGATLPESTPPGELTIENSENMNNVVTSELEVIDLQANLIEKLPNFENLKNLKVLDLEANRLTEFPPGIEYCTQLTHLNVKRNRIRLVPPAISTLSQTLFFLSVRYNPIANVPPVVILKGIAPVLRYLQESSAQFVEQDEGTLKKDLEKNLLFKDFLADVQLSCIDNVGSDTEVTKLVPAHSAILCARSSVFEEKLKSLSKESKTPLIIHTKHSYDEIKMLLEYIYVGKFQPPDIQQREMEKRIYDNFQHRSAVETSLAEFNNQLKLKFIDIVSRWGSVAETFNLPHLQFLIECHRIAAQRQVSFDFLTRNLEKITIISPKSSSWESDMKFLFSHSRTHNVFFAAPKGPNTSIVDCESNNNNLNSTGCERTCENGYENFSRSEIGAHRAILSARSPVLKAMLTGGLAESSQRTIHARDDMHWRVLQQILHFAYMDDYNVETLDSDIIVPLITQSIEFGLSRLTSILESVMGCSIDANNAASFLSFAMTYKLKKLGKATEYYLFTNWDSVTLTVEWQELDPQVREKLAAIRTTIDAQ